MSQFYALMQNNTVQRIVLKEEIIDDVKSLFLNAWKRLKPDDIEEDEFNGDIMPRSGENITYVNYSLPEDFSLIPANQADMPEYTLNGDVPKSIFWYENGVFIFQVFSRRNILQRKTVLTIEIGNKFTKLIDSAFVVEDKVHAIYENGKLFFKSYTSANNIFSLIDFVTEATNEDIESFSEDPHLVVEPVLLKNLANIKTRRLIKLLSQTQNIATFMGKAATTRTRLLKKYGINAHIDNQGNLVLPTNNVAELNRTLEFLNEDMFMGEITKSRYRVNSKKKD